jgi:ABC-type phosphate transport system auxiliary subunit
VKRDRAIRLAVEAIQAQIHKLAVDANLHDVYGADYPQAINASAKRKELLEAIEILERHVIQPGLLEDI